MKGAPPSDRTRGVLPISLLGEGRQGLVVGGGHVARRKAEHLLAAGAAVTVVSPETHAGLRELERQGKITCRRRPFEPADSDGMDIVFAATSDAAVNLAVLAAARERGALCCVVDRGWTEGDFVTPAILRQDELSVAISTGGRSCRRSRMIKDSLARHLDAVTGVELLVLGTSHEQLSLDRRERFHLAGDRLAEVGAMLTHVWGLHEFVPISTCNRVELHAVVASGPETERLIRRVLGFDALPDDAGYSRRGPEAFRHAGLLLAGLLSQTPGENHIVAQVKEAAAAAAAAGWAGAMMKEWLDSALHVSKHIRQAIGPMLRDFEIEDLCLDYLLAEHASGLEGGLAVIGAGVVGRGVVERALERAPTTRITWCYRRHPPELPSGAGDRVRTVSLNELRELLPSAHTIVCAADSSGHVLHQGHAPFLDQDADVRIVDLGVPRNVAPELDGIAPNVHVADLDDLKHWYRREAADLAEMHRIARELADQHGDLYGKLMRGFEDRNAVQ